MTDHSTPSPVILNVGTHTDVGCQRALNEDSVLSTAPIFIVADGMGGHDAGEVASAAVIQAFEPLIGHGSTSVPAVAAAVARANQAVARLSAQQQHGAGSTLTGIAQVTYEDTPHWLIMNLGDSRVYRILRSEFHQLTKDHSLVQELVDQGNLTPEQAAHSRHKNVITRAVGAEFCTPDFWIAPVVTGERFLICSDGLSGEVSESSLRAMMMLSGTVQDTADALVRAALQHGGRDNVSVIVVDVVSGGLTGHEGDTDGWPTDSSTVQRIVATEDDATVPTGKARA